MQFTATLIASFLACSIAVATPAGSLHSRDTLTRCGAEPPESFSLLVADMQEAERNGSISHIEATIEVETYFHVVASSTSVADGYLTDTMLSDQLAVMNSNYAPHGISFSLAGTTKTVNSNWASDGAELTMKKQLRQGSYDALNVYFMKDMAGLLGYCYFPTTVTTGSNDFYYDGCTILSSSVPGGSTTNYNLGKTATHEIGHWFGLYHTFQGGCTGSGDSIDDTPAQASASSGCPTGRDSCPSQAGVDPIHNYMDYSYDSCYEEFTADQQTRMYNLFNTYRA